MEEKYKKFLEFSWKDSSDWQMYYTNLSEIPHPTKVEHFKKRFYKLKIDPDFDVKWTPPATNASGPSNQSFNPSSNYNAYSAPTSSINSPLLASTEAFMWLSFLLTVFLSHHTLKLAALALLIRVFRRTGRPRFTMDYAQVIFLDEHFQLLLYALLLMIDRINFFTLVPLGITAVLNLSDYIKNNQRNFGFLMPYVNTVINKRVDLAMMRANAEIAIGFLLVIGIFLGLNSFMLPIFFWQYLRFKYIVNNDIKTSFSRLNNVITNFKNKPAVPTPLKFVLDKVQQFGEYMGRTEPGPGQAAGGANCLIF